MQIFTVNDGMAKEVLFNLNLGILDLKLLLEKITLTMAFK